MTEQAHAGDQTPRAYLRLGGATLARHQLLLALAAGCERIACVARALDHELIALQHEAEKAGARLHMISGSRELSGLVTAADELLVFADGLVPGQSEALDLIGASPAVLVLPAETAVPVGFERIDLNHASAGLMLLPGRLVERLNDLLPDAEPVSALLRIALQAGITQRMVPQAIVAHGRWLLVRSEDQAAIAEAHWMERYTSGKGRTPGLAIAAFAVRTFGAALLHGGGRARALAPASFALVALAAGAGWFGFFAVAVALCGVAWLLHRSAAIVDQFQRESLGGKRGLFAADVPFSWVLDFVIAGLLTMAASASAGETLWERAFAPIMLFGLLMLVPIAKKGRWTEWLADRALLCLVLFGLFLAGGMDMGIRSIAVGLVLAGIFVRPASSSDDVITSH